VQAVCTQHSGGCAACRDFFAGPFSDPALFKRQALPWKKPMPSVLEISLKPHLFDAQGASVAKKARDYFGIPVDLVRVVTVLTFDIALTPEQLEIIRTEIFTNPVTQVSSFKPLEIPFDWAIWVGFRPGVRDNPGATALEAIVDILGEKLPPKSQVYTSRPFVKTQGLFLFALTVTQALRKLPESL
jgi:phosphoribosylformylglycinamidine (FGAM) synthase PurS component